MALPSRTEVEAILADPRGVISGIVGFDIPANVQVVLHEESLTQIHLTIPATDHLADDELGLVAGGGLVCWADNLRCN